MPIKRTRQNNKEEIESHQVLSLVRLILIA